MAANFRSNVYEGGLTVDPRAGAGVPAAIGSLLPRRGTTELYQKFGAGNTDWLLLFPNSIITWSVGEAWADVYAEIQAAPKPVVCLVEFDPAGARTMTNNGGVDTDLWDVQFVGLSPSFRQVAIEVDDGFVLGEDPDTSRGILISKEIDWTFDCTTAEIYSGAGIALFLEGGSIQHTGANFCFVAAQVTNTLYARGRLTGTGGQELISAGAAGCSMVLLDNSSLGTDTSDNGGVYILTLDSSSGVGASAFSAGTPTIQLVSDAAFVFYADTAPLLGADTVQEAIDALKNRGAAILTWGADAIGTAADTRFLPPGRILGTAPGTDDFPLPVTRGGTLRRLFVFHDAPPGGAVDIVYTVLVNGVATAITVTLSAAAGGPGSDIVNTAAVLAGDRISLRLVKAAIIASTTIRVQASLEAF